MAPPRLHHGCSVDGCKNPHASRGLCRTHYSIWRNRPDCPLGLVKYRNRVCSVDGCNQKSQARGLCPAHYDRWRNHGDPLAGRAPDRTHLKFIEIVASIFDGEECLYLPGLPRTRRVIRTVDGSAISHSRLVCELAHGTPPNKSLEALHSCGNGHVGCVNPKHLRWGTHAENMQDMVNHGRSRKGSLSVYARLDETKVSKIKSLIGKLPDAEIASAYGVVTGTIAAIRRGETWRHV